jgi:hypothetical protein
LPAIRCRDDRFRLGPAARSAGVRLFVCSFVGDRETWSQTGLAMVFFTIGGIIAMVMWSFL